MQTHYVDLVPASGIVYEVYARLLKGVHLANVESHGLTVDWPGWRNERGQFGQVMRVFGTETGLEHLLELASPLLRNGLASSASGITIVPVGVECTHTFKRCRAADKNTPSHQRRLVRRAEQRGEVYVPGSPRPTALHSLRMQSETNGQSFYMDLCRYSLSGAAEYQNAKPDSYGFGVPVPSF